MRTRTLVGVLVCALLLLSCCSSNDADPGPTATPSAAASERISFPPDRLRDGKSEWEAGFKDYSGGVIDSDAWLIGSWWALTDWCEGHNKPCLDEAAVHVKAVFQRDPQAINACGWRGAIGGAVADGYEDTWKVLDKDVHVMLPDLFERHYVPKCPED